MKPFGIILGLAIAGLGAYLTCLAWQKVSLGHPYPGGGLGGPSFVILGLFLLVRSTGKFSASPILRYVFLAIAIVIGVANIAALEAVYPNSFFISNNR
jgi:hypothetical protein